MCVVGVVAWKRSSRKRFAVYALTGVTRALVRSECQKDYSPDCLDGAKFEKTRRRLMEWKIAARRVMSSNDDTPSEGNMQMAIYHA